MYSHSVEHDYNNIVDMHTPDVLVLGFNMGYCVLVWRSRPSQEEGLVKCLYRARGRQPESGRPRKYVSVVDLRKLTTTRTDLPSEALAQARLTVQDSTPSCI